MNKNKILTFTTIVSLGLLSGCMVGPDFEKPKSGNLLNDSWNDEQNINSTHNAELSQWWKSFNDAELNSLIERALAQNLDLEQTKYRVLQARASLGMSQSALLPTIDASAAMSERTLTGIHDVAKPSYSAGMSSSWEIDIFGGTRRQVEANIALYNASFASEAASRISLIAQVAESYFQYRATQIAIEITKKNLETQKVTYKITQQRKENGLVSELDVVRAGAQVESTSAEIPVLEITLEQARHSLEYLLALNSGALRDELESTVAFLPDLEKYIPLGIPAQLLERRPDIIVAEYNFKEAVAKIGVAKADFFPKFSIKGNIAYQAPDVGNMFQSQYGTWSVGPNISWNLLNSGKTTFNVEKQKAYAKEYEAKWKASVLTAAKEVEDSLIASQKNREKINMVISLVKMNQKAFDLSKRLYSEGELEFLDLLETQRSLLTSEQNLVSSRKNIISNFIALYKALGGGWSMDEITKEKEELREGILFTEM